MLRSVNTKSCSASPANSLRASTVAITLGAGLFLSAIPVIPDPVAELDSTPQAQADGGGPSDPVWERTLRLVREAFPEVPQMTTQQLAAIRADGAARDIVLLDARTSAEFNVSHLPGALLASNPRMALDALEPNDPERTVVVYCSVGYRSSRLVAQLRARGFENIFNLERSLFQWANEGRPLYRGNDRVHRAHHYDEEWGAFAPQAVLVGLSPYRPIPNYAKHHY